MSTPTNQCSHGKTWEEPCAECEAVWMRDVSLPQIKRSAQRQKQMIEQMPGIASDPYMMVALLDHVQMLCDQVAALTAQPPLPGKEG